MSSALMGESALEESLFSTLATSVRKLLREKQTREVQLHGWRVIVDMRPRASGTQRCILSIIAPDGQKLRSIAALQRCLEADEQGRASSQEPQSSGEQLGIDASPAADAVSSSAMSPSAASPPHASPRSLVGEGMVGRRVRVFWDEDGAWHAGRVLVYEAASSSHSVGYDNGAQRSEDLNSESLMWELEDDFSGHAGAPAKPSPRNGAHGGECDARHSAEHVAAESKRALTPQPPLEADSPSAPSALLSCQACLSSELTAEGTQRGPGQPARDSGPSASESGRCSRDLEPSTRERAQPMLNGSAQPRRGNPARLSRAARAAYLRKPPPQACTSPEVLVARRIRVYWADDAAWYAGRVAMYNAATESHTVVYDDGDQRAEVLVGGSLVWAFEDEARAPPPPPLRADKVNGAGTAKHRPTAQPRASPSKRLRRADASVCKEPKRPDVAARPSASHSAHGRASAAVGRRVRVYWADDAAWYAGRVAQYNAATEEHTVVYDDGEQRAEPLSSDWLVWAFEDQEGQPSTLERAAAACSEAAQSAQRVNPLHARAGARSSRGEHAPRSSKSSEARVRTSRAAELVTVSSVRPPPAPSPLCRCRRPAVWQRQRWWCASRARGCGFETEAPPDERSPVCKCGERAAFVRGRWWCARSNSRRVGCGFSLKVNAANSARARKADEHHLEGPSESVVHAAPSEILKLELSLEPVDAEPLD